MRLFEIVNAPREIKATERFRREFASFASEPDVRKRLIDFLTFKQTSDLTAQFNRKDAPFRFGDRKGFWHCHLIFGKRVVTYEIDGQSIYLAALTDHAAYEGRKTDGFDTFLKNLRKTDFTPFSAQPVAAADDNAPPAPDRVWIDVRDLAYDLTSDSDRDVLEAMAKGDPRPFLAFTRLIPLQDADVLRVFDNSRAKMVSFAEKVLTDTKIVESRDRSASRYR